MYRVNPIQPLEVGRIGCVRNPVEIEDVRTSTGQPLLDEVRAGKTATSGNQDGFRRHK